MTINIEMEDGISIIIAIMVGLCLGQLFRVGLSNPQAPILFGLLFYIVGITITFNLVTKRGIL